MSEITTPVRPTWNEEMTKELAKIVGEQVNKWCQNETELDECIEAAEKVLRWHSNDDGYEMAKEFEDEGFSPDAELVEILEAVSWDRHKILKDAITKWVTENNLTLDFKVGDIVKTTIYRKGEIEVEIMKLYPETMQYVVWYEGQGSIKGNGGTIIDAEKVKLLINT